MNGNTHRVIQELLIFFVILGAGILIVNYIEPPGNIADFIVSLFGLLVLLAVPLLLLWRIIPRSIKQAYGIIFLLVWNLIILGVLGVIALAYFDAVVLLLFLSQRHRAS